MPVGKCEQSRRTRFQRLNRRSVRRYLNWICPLSKQVFRALTVRHLSMVPCWCWCMASSSDKKRRLVGTWHISKFGFCQVQLLFLRRFSQVFILAKKSNKSSTSYYCYNSCFRYLELYEERLDGEEEETEEPVGESTQEPQWAADAAQSWSGAQEQVSVL